MTPDIDRLQTILQWAGGIAVIIAGAIAGIWKVIKGGAAESDRSRDERERGERSKRYTLERELEIERLERRFEKIIESLRVSILGEMEKHQTTWREDFKEINGRVSDIERDRDAR